MKKTMLVLMFFGLLLSCKKENNNSVLNSFISLEAESTTIGTGQSTGITATVDGTGVSFSWSATAGDIIGSGNQVTYIAPPCTPGSNIISCTASAANRSETKTITIMVL